MTKHRLMQGIKYKLQKCNINQHEVIPRMLLFFGVDVQKILKIKRSDRIKVIVIGKNSLYVYKIKQRETGSYVLLKNYNAKTIYIRFAWYIKPPFLSAFKARKTAKWKRYKKGFLLELTNLKNE